jgi:hypothetical protein
MVNNTTVPFLEILKVCTMELKASSTSPLRLTLLAPRTPLFKSYDIVILGLIIKHFYPLKIYIIIQTHYALQK